MKPESYKFTEEEDVVEPVDLTQVKKQLKMEGFDEDDDYLELLIKAAREKCEEYTERSFVEKTVILGYKGWPCDRILDLARPPIGNNEAFKIEYKPADGGDWTMLDGSKYDLDVDVLPGIIKLTRS